MAEKSPAKQIDDIIKHHGGWKSELLSHIREVVKSADASIEEGVKWKMPTRPEGLPVWSSNGIVCFAEIWKDNIKLIFFKGARLKDAQNLFNSRLKSKDIRAIEYKEGDSLDKDGLSELVKQAVKLNGSK